MDDQDNSQVIASLNELHGLLGTEEPLKATLERVAKLACATIGGCDAVGVTLVADGHVTTAAATDDFTLRIDADQYDNREGPCLQALSTQEIVTVANIGEDRRWPNFGQQAAKDGLGSVLSVPLEVRDEPMGALNLYSKKARSFSQADRPVAKLFARQAAVAISNAQVYESAVRLADQLKEAIKTREIIGEAKGILMAQEGVGEDEAFEMLKRVSQNSNVKLREIAQRMVTEAPKKPAPR